jgi:hypothetical protein
MGWPTSITLQFHFPALVYFFRRRTELCGVAPSPAPATLAGELTEGAGEAGMGEAGGGEKGPLEPAGRTGEKKASETSACSEDADAAGLRGRAQRDVWCSAVWCRV